MKSIHIVKEYEGKSIYSIGPYSFVEKEDVKPCTPIYHIQINEHLETELDVRLWLDDMDENINCLLESPKELTYFINEYESNDPFKENCLFHDLRTHYLEIVQLNFDSLDENLVFVGYSIHESEICLSVKAFSFESLLAFYRIVYKYCEKRGIAVKSIEDIKWLHLEKYLLPDVNIYRNDIHSLFLEKTLSDNLCKYFLDAFREIDTNGYITNSFFNKDLTFNEHTTPLSKVSQFTKYFSAYWKMDIAIKNPNKSVLCLYDEILNNESAKNVVYTMKPHLMQYYQLHWFEDFCSSILERIEISDFTVEKILTGRRFNFFSTNKDSDIREIDIVFSVRNETKHRIIAVECKKTLSHHEISDTNSKIKKKVLDSRSNIIDAYIHIGCFSSDVIFDKYNKEYNIRYKQDLLQDEENEEINDAPYYVFDIKSSLDLKNKLIFVINDILEQW